MCEDARISSYCPMLSFAALGLDLNDIATLSALILSAVSTYYVMTDTRRKVGKLVIEAVEDPRFFEGDDDYGDLPRFSFEILVNNKGREPISITSVAVYLDDYDEILSFNRGREGSRIELGPTNQKNVYMRATPRCHIEESKGPIDGELMVNSSKGTVTQHISFRV